jgi:MFS family permease
VRTFFNVYLDTALAVPAAQIGAIMGIAQLLPVVAVLSAPLLIARLGTGYALVAAVLGIGVCLLPLATTPPLWGAALAFMAVLAMSTVAGATRDLLGQEMVPLRWRTTSQGIAIMGLALGWATGGMVGGSLIETRGFGVTFLVGAIAALIAAGLLVAYLRRFSSATAHPEPKLPN